jgi:hypothetical protein
MLLKVAGRNSTELMSSRHLHVRLSCSASAELLVMRGYREISPVRATLRLVRGSITLKNSTPCFCGFAPWGPRHGRREPLPPLRRDLECVRSTEPHACEWFFPVQHEGDHRSVFDMTRPRRKSLERGYHQADHIVAENVWAIDAHGSLPRTFGAISIIGARLVDLDIAGVSRRGRKG